MRLNVSCAQCRFLRVFFSFFFFGVERLRLRENHLGGGREYIVVHLHSYSYKISHSLQESSRHPCGFSSIFVRLACVGFCTTDQKQRRYCVPLGGSHGGFLFSIISFLLRTHTQLIRFGSSWVKLLYARIDGVSFLPSPGVCVFHA